MPRPPLGLKEGERKWEGEAGVEVCAQDGRDPPSDGLRPGGQRGGKTYQDGAPEGSRHGRGLEGGGRAGREVSSGQTEGGDSYSWIRDRPDVYPAYCRPSRSAPTSVLQPSPDTTAAHVTLGPQPIQKSPQASSASKVETAGATAETAATGAGSRGPAERREGAGGERDERGRERNGRCQHGNRNMGP